LTLRPQSLRRPGSVHQYVKRLTEFLGEPCIGRFGSDNIRASLLLGWK